MKQILLADDNAELRSALRLLIETRLDQQLVSEARDMEHVLAQVEDMRPDCIVLDWELPGRPRNERVQVLRALVPAMKIIVTSARPEAREEALSQGADAFAGKSEAPSTILEAMRACAGGKE